MIWLLIWLVIKKLNLVVTEFNIRGRNLNVSIVFITQSYFKVPKKVRLNTKQFLIMKNVNKRELQQMAINHSSNINFKDFIKIYKIMYCKTIFFSS